MSYNVSNKTYHIKDYPYYVTGERIVGDFTSNNHQFNEISIDDYEGDVEIWYMNRTNPSGSVLAYANNTWEIEYKYITFNNNVSLSDEDFHALVWLYDEYIPTRKLRITYQGTTMLGRINGMLKGTFTYQGTAYPFENKIKWETPTISLDGADVSTEIVNGVTKYKVYMNGEYVGYIDENNQWHLSWEYPEQQGNILTLKQVNGASLENNVLTLT